MKKCISVALAFLAAFPLCAAAQQEVLSLDSCRAMALANNKRLLAGGKEIEKAYYTHKAAKTNYLPKLSASATYIRNSRETHLLSKSTRRRLNNLGTSIAEPLSASTQLVETYRPELSESLSQFGNNVISEISDVGHRINKGFETDTRNMFAGALTITQPLYMGGRIRAYDKITGYARQIAEESHRGEMQDVILDVDEAYWQTVSLSNKKRLAENNVALLQRIDSDMQKMIREGVATRANGLTVSVRLNEAEMSLTKVDDGLSLSRMNLCQLCGLPIGSSFSLADEGGEFPGGASDNAAFNIEEAYANRPELRSLELAEQINERRIQVARAEFLPKIALTGNYMLTNPSVYNGFENKLKGAFNVGVMLSAPLFEWGESKYKVRAAKADAAIARYNLAEAREKVELQVNQQAFRVGEAAKTLRRALANRDRADENLRTAQTGFKAGVIPTSDLLAAQTAWLSAHSDVIDAEIDTRLAQLYLQKSLGTLK